MSIGDFAEGARKPPKKGEGLPENFHSALNDYLAYFPRGNGEIPAPPWRGSANKCGIFFIDMVYCIHCIHSRADNKPYFFHRI